MKTRLKYLIIAIICFACASTEEDYDYDGITSSEYADSYKIRSNRHPFVVAFVSYGRLCVPHSLYGLGEVIAVMNKNQIIRGRSRNGEVLATVVGNHVIKGASEDGEIIATIDGDDIIKGATKYGYYMGTISEPDPYSAAMGAVYLLMFSTDEFPDRNMTFIRQTLPSGKIIAVIENGKLYNTPRHTTQIYAHVEGDKIIKGDKSDGRILATIDGDKVVNTKGETEAITYKNMIFTGNTPDGALLGYIDGDSPVAGALGITYYTTFIDKYGKWTSGDEIDTDNNPIDKYTKIKIINRNAGYAPVVALVKDSKLTVGGWISDDVILRIIGNKIVKGNSATGEVIATIKGFDALIEGDREEGSIIASMTGNEINAGPTMFDTVIGKIEGKEPRAGLLGAAYLLLVMDK